jgi:hypothetical protein
MKKLFRAIYPKVRQDILWHRVVLVVGWTLSILSLGLFPLTFAIYFGIIQRAIFFIVYGKDESKWRELESKLG